MCGFGASYAGTCITSIHSSSNTLSRNRVGGAGENPGCPQAKKRPGHVASSATDRRLHSHSHLRSISSARVRLFSQHTPVVCGRGPGRANETRGEHANATQNSQLRRIFKKIRTSLEAKPWAGQHSKKNKVVFLKCSKNIKRPLHGCLRPWMRRQM